MFKIFWTNDSHEHSRLEKKALRIELDQSHGLCIRAGDLHYSEGTWAILKHVVLEVPKRFSGFRCYSENVRHTWGDGTAKRAIFAHSDGSGVYSGTCPNGPYFWMLTRPGSYVELVERKV